MVVTTAARTTAFHVVVPVSNPPALVDVTQRLIEALRLQAQGYVSGFVHVIVVDAAACRIWCA
jgi:hypothetical protein